MPGYAIRLNNHTATLNQLTRGKRKARIALAKRDHDWLALAAKTQGVPPAEGKRRVSLLVVLGKGQRGADPDAWWKSVLDSLKGAGLLKDDSRKWVELGPVEYTRAEKAGMVITLEDLPCPTT